MGIRLPLWFFNPDVLRCLLAVGALRKIAEEVFKNSVKPKLAFNEFIVVRPDLAPMDFRVFPEVKSQLRGIRFASKQELTVAAKRIVSSFDADWYQNSRVDCPFNPNLLTRFTYG
ncbi:hypothetical protein DPMN_122327 [Dreissena polymorpha]|uniref:Uncharacterized protein n=1 Tax=Dreissena polymorpha TaxID=45954 RepID=A0A9D4JUD6_DREPO|nr:hypothetical protein DPMN_122327 [Dreissena polymorpha]